MRWSGVLTACSVIVGSMGGCVAADDLQQFDASRVSLLQMEPLMEGEDIAILATDDGEIRIRFFPSEAPQAVQNFMTLAREGYYNDKAIAGPGKLLDGYRQVLLAGGEDAGQARGVSRVNGGRPFKKELSANLWHFTGAVSVLGNRREKGDSRFFITGTREIPEETLEELARAQYPPAVVEAFRALGGAPEFSLEYSVFAQVVEGQEVVDRIIERVTDGGTAFIRSVSFDIYDDQTQ